MHFTGSNNVCANIRLNSLDSSQATIPNLPDPAICRVKQDKDKLFDCIVENPLFCPHVFGFGSRRFCYHPKRESFLVGESIGDAVIATDAAGRIIFV